MNECSKPHVLKNQIFGQNIPLNHFLVVDAAAGTAALWQRLGPGHASRVVYPESYLQRYWSRGYGDELRPA